MICFTHFSVSYEECVKYLRMIDSIISNKNCPVCDYIRFFELLKTQYVKDTELKMECKKQN
ncbi:hypothetical protein NBO_6g0005 [Nosema bombycis CQ1]|uniref:Uncharacterized protein n=1 Tax=Nosema bombycis (strain CQ1 / CVCC 102059) TaxID=578461 RepID=R0KYG0_NOSB1|nr:hypothetical protein NBO_6g0005 [Nosema bombycis CQ1]|eukprot:EOB15252.1 hypothetical protein NBO_6g0005 [Nosema bombycis CQ1]